MDTSNAYTDEQMLAIGEAARFVGLSVATLRDYDRRGLIEAKRTPAGQRRFRVGDLRALLNQPAPSADDSPARAS